MKLAMKTCIVAIAGIGVICATLFSSSMRKDPSTIEQALLREKPLGTQMAEIERWLAHDKKLAPTASNVGFLRQHPPPSRVVGVKSIKAKLGEYFSFPLLRTSVVAFWGFNERGELIEVWVWKTIDAP
jgi:hypothetical protein